MTRGKRLNAAVLEATSVEDAIAKLQALKKQRAQGQETKTESGAAQKRGRPANVQRSEEEAQSMARSSSTSPPARRGHRPKEALPEGTGAAADQAARPSFGVGKLTAHRPLGLLEVQESSDLDALMADPRLAGQIAMRLDERFALVLPASLERLQAALLKAGHTPKLTGPRLSDKARA